MLGFEGEEGNSFPHLAFCFFGLLDCDAYTRQRSYWQNPLITVPTFCGSDRRSIGDALLKALSKGEQKEYSIVNMRGKGGAQTGSETHRWVEKTDRPNHHRCTPSWRPQSLSLLWFI